MKKVLLAFLLTITLALSMSFSVYAVGDGSETDDVAWHSTMIFDGITQTWVDSTDWTTWDSSTGTLKVLRYSFEEAKQYTFFGLRSTWSPNGYIEAEEGYYLLFDFDVSANYTTSSSNPTDVYYKVTLKLDDDSTVELEPYHIVNTTSGGTPQYMCYFAVEVGDGSAVRIDSVTFETNMPSQNVGQSAYTLFCTFDFATQMTPEMKKHQELITTIDGAAQDIIDNADENTQEIITNDNANAQQLLAALMEWFEAVKEKIKSGSDEVVDAIGEQTDEDFGFSEDSDKAQTDAEIDDLADQISALSDDIDQSVDDFASSIDDLKGYLQKGQTFIWGWLDYVPGWFTAIITGFAGLLLARKIVK